MPRTIRRRGMPHARPLQRSKQQPQAVTLPLGLPRRHPSPQYLLNRGPRCALSVNCGVLTLHAIGAASGQATATVITFADLAMMQGGADVRDSPESWIPARESCLEPPRDSSV